MYSLLKRSNKLAFFSIVLVITVLLWAFVIPNESKRACGSVEWEFQEGFECLANRHMWKKWDEIAQIYNADPKKSRGTISCPIYIQSLRKYSLNGTDRLLFLYLAETNGEMGMKWQFKKETKRDFCEVAQEKGWLEIYLKNKEGE